MTDLSKIVGKGVAHEETIRRINALDVSEGKKIRYKIVLALEAKEDLYDPRRFDELPLEMMVGLSFVTFFAHSICHCTLMPSFSLMTSYKAIPLGDDSARSRRG